MAASGEGGHWGAKILKKTMAPFSLSLRLLSIVAFGERGGGRQNHAKDNQWRIKGQGGISCPRAPPGGGAKEILWRCGREALGAPKC